MEPVVQLVSISYQPKRYNIILLSVVILLLLLSAEVFLVYSCGNTNGTFEQNNISKIMINRYFSISNKHEIPIFTLEVTAA